MSLIHGSRVQPLHYSIPLIIINDGAVINTWYKLILKVVFSWLPVNRTRHIFHRHPLFSNVFWRLVDVTWTAGMNLNLSVWKVLWDKLLHNLRLHTLGRISLSIHPLYFLPSFIYTSVAPVVFFPPSSSVPLSERGGNLFITLNSWASIIKSFILSKPQLFSSKEPKSND